MIKWEYLTKDESVPLSDVTLNELGSEGWELVSFTWHLLSLVDLRPFGDPVTSGQFHYVFKRPRVLSKEQIAEESAELSDQEGSEDVRGIPISLCASSLPVKRE
jgi:hypothetical protein